MRAVAAIVLMLCSAAISAQSQTYTCISDLGASGSIDNATEQATCTEYAAGRVCPLQAEQCVANATSGALECPSNPALACVDTGTGTSMCSPNQCFDVNTVPRSINDPPRPVTSDNGPRDASGACLGQLIVFSGKALRCREAGTQTLFHNCCTDNGSMDDTMGEDGGSSQGGSIIGSLTSIILNQCDTEDNQASFFRRSDYCVYLGRYCAEDWGLGCVQHARMYCCFNSRLAKIIHEQGRPQLTTFAGGFGDEDEPNCRGFTMEEFQALDFSKIDLSQYADELRTRSQQTMEGNARGNAAQKLGGF